MNFSSPDTENDEAWSRLTVSCTVHRVVRFCHMCRKTERLILCKLPVHRLEVLRIKAMS